MANVTASRISSKRTKKSGCFRKTDTFPLILPTSIIHVQPGDADNNCPIPGMHLGGKCFTDGDALEDEIRSFVHMRWNIESPLEVSGQMGRDALKIALDITRQIRESSKVYE
ncbi:MAG: hypothetical protein R2861_08420 [Desulfobacterales bacterium]